MSICGINFTPCRSGTAVSKDGVELHYEVYGRCDGSGDEKMLERPKVIMIMGLAAGCGAWEPQLEDMLYPPGYEEPPMDICVFDNRGIGNSSVPKDKNSYSTRIMAEDVAAIMDALGWSKVHLVGFSMGGMIATKFGAMYPEKLDSLSLIGATAGGFQVLPRSWRAVKYGIKILTADSMEKRAWFDLKFHFTSKTLKTKVDENGAGSMLRRDCLYEEYLEAHQEALEQPREALDGQMHACWKHTVTAANVATIRQGEFPVLVIHGRKDLVAAPKYGRKLAKKLRAKFVEVDGAHLVTRECGHDVNHELVRIVLDRSSKEHRNRHLISGISRRGDSARSEISTDTE